jgi:hypothetical protein
MTATVLERDGGQLVHRWYAYCDECGWATPTVLPTSRVAADRHAMRHNAEAHGEDQ